MIKGLTNSEVAHVWAQQRTSENGALMCGQSGNGNFSFMQRVLYSYSTPMAIIVEHKGETYVFENREKYSVTTSAKHMSQVQERILPYACKYYPVYNALDEIGGRARTPSHDIIDSLNFQSNSFMTSSDKAERMKQCITKVIKGLLEQAVISANTSKRARSEWNKNHYASESVKLLEQAQELASTFKVKSRVKVPNDLEVYAAIVGKKEKAFKMKQALRRARLEQKARVQDAEKFAQWKEGAPVSCPISYRAQSDGTCYVRVIKYTEAPWLLETSQGVRVDFKDALKVFRFVKLIKERGKPWSKNGARIKIGHYEIDSINTKGDMVAGCHKFSFKTMQALASLLDVNQEPLDILA